MTEVKWKYCAIKSNAGVKYFDENGDHVFDKFKNDEKDFHKLIAQLGLDNWELVTMAHIAEESAWVYYFKKPLESN